MDPWIQSLMEMIIIYPQTKWTCTNKHRQPNWQLYSFYFILFWHHTYEDGRLGSVTLKLYSWHFKLNVLTEYRNYHLYYLLWRNIHYRMYIQSWLQRNERNNTSHIWQQVTDFSKLLKSGCSCGLPLFDKLCFINVPYQSSLHQTRFLSENQLDYLKKNSSETILYILVAPSKPYMWILLPTFIHQFFFCWNTWMM